MDATMTKPELLPYQREAVDRAIASKRFGVFLDMGLGKSRVAVEVVNHVAAHRIGEVRVLVMAPNTLLENWEAEIRRWDRAAAEVRLLRGTMGRRRADLLAKPKARVLYLVVNYDSLAALWRDFYTAPPTVVVADESTFIKNPTAKRSKAATVLAHEAEYRLILSGRPIVNAELDAFSQFYFLDPGIIGYKTWTAFRRAFAYQVGANGRRWWVPNRARSTELMRLIEPSMIRVRREEVMRVPEDRRATRHVDLHKEQRIVYDELCATFRAELAGAERIVATTILARIRRLMQVTGGFVPVTAADGGSILREVPASASNPKMLALREMVETEMEDGARFVVWAVHRAEIVSLGAMLEGMKVPVATLYGDTPPSERQRVVDDFRAGRLRCLVANPQVGGYGLNLPEALIQVFYSSDWSLGNREQAEARSKRLGQTHSVLYVDLIARNTLDEEIARALAEKRTLDDMLKSWTPAEAATRLFGERGGD